MVARKMERKDIEKNRRQEMKSLRLQLSSLLSNHSLSSSSSSTFKGGAIKQVDHLDEAAAYIKQLKQRIDELKRKKNKYYSETLPPEYSDQPSTKTLNLKSSCVIEVRQHDDTLDVALVMSSSLCEPYLKLHEVITVLEQEGAEVLHASFSVVGDIIFYTIHSQALSSRIGLEASRVSDRLHELFI